MSTIAIKVPFQFYAVFDASSAGVNFTTPTAIGHKLGALQAIKYKTAEFKAFNDSDAAVTVTLKHGGAALAALSLAAGSASAVAVDVYPVSGAAALVIDVDVTSTGTGTGQVQAVLDVEQPVIVSGC